MSAKHQIHESHDLRSRVHFVLAHNPFLGGRDIRCEIVDDDVVLKGCVRTYYQKQMAQESLRKVRGIKRITNELAVVQN